jgi:hypothetical protein
MFDDTECTEEDILVCEKYVLKRMGISEDDFDALCSAIAVSAARMARKEAAEKTMHEASKTVAAEVENQVAKLVLAEILIAVDIALAERTLIGITVPAYRKAIPGVIYVALLRKLHAAESAFRASSVNKPMEHTPRHPRGNAGRRRRHARAEAGVGIRV